MAAPSVAALRDVATQLRIDSVASTSQAGSGHPTTCLSAADIMAVLFFCGDALRSEEPAESRQRSLRAVEGACGADPLRRLGRGRSLSARAADGAADVRVGSRRPSDAAAAVRRRRDRLARTGHLRRDRHRAERAAHRLGYRTYVLLGDGEIAEGSVWEAADAASHYKLDNLCAIVDANALGQSQPTEFRPRPESHRRPLERVRLEGDRGRRPRHRRRPEGTGRWPARPAVSRPCSWRAR